MSIRALSSRLWLAPWIVLLALCLAPADARAAEAKKDKNGSYVAIDTLTATVLGGNGRHEVMTVQSGVDAPDPALRGYVEKVIPRLL
ncbi:MAG TPA: hypothetical protein VG939_17035, partial [Caulobacteraceae bacterium]|nr:hypothetical protein [Caulobacteraceae bacterium]